MIQNRTKNLAALVLFCLAPAPTMNGSATPFSSALQNPNIPTKKASNYWPLTSSIKSHPYFFIGALSFVGISSLLLWKYQDLKKLMSAITPTTPAPQFPNNEIIIIPPKTAQNIGEMANKEPWKTAEHAQAIATGLEATLNAELSPHLTNAELSPHLTKKEIDTLQNDSKNFDLPHTLIKRCTIPAEAKLYIIGDLHGDFGPIEALLTHLQNKKKFDPTTGFLDEKIYIAFLGDYIDRGPESLKNLWYLWKLKAVNQSQVLLLRGNHETKEIFTNPLSKTLWQDLLMLNTVPKVIDNFVNAFSLLPVVTLIDRANQNNRIALVHGGINPADKTIPLIDRSQSFVVHNSDANAYLWSDMADDPTKQISKKNSGRGAGYILGKKDVTTWMKTQNVKVIFHGHDQSQRTYPGPQGKKIQLFSEGKWRGIGSRWDDQAIVLNVAPNTQCYNLSTQWYSDYGTIACIKQSKKSKTSSKPSDAKFATNTQPQEIKKLPFYLLQPLYFLPLKPSVIVPNTQVLKKRPQKQYAEDNNEQKKQ